MEDNRPLFGRTAVVTGAANGLGFAIASRLEAAGATIVGIDRPDTFETAPASWRKETIDLTDDGAQDRLSALANALGRVDVVVANAGLVPPWRELDVLDLAEWDQVMRVNVWGVAATIGAFVGALEKSPHPSVVAMASINGYRAAAQQTLYTASKHAVLGVVRTAALELGPRNIRVNALAPGPIATDALLDRVQARHEGGGPPPDEALAVLASGNALGRLVTEQDIANAALFLASDASAGMTGVIMPLEAGMA